MPLAVYLMVPEVTLYVKGEEVRLEDWPKDEMVIKETVLGHPVLFNVSNVAMVKPITEEQIKEQRKKMEEMQEAMAKQQGHVLTTFGQQGRIPRGH